MNEGIIIQFTVFHWTEIAHSLNEGNKSETFIKELPTADNIASEAPLAHVFFYSRPSD